MEKVTQRRSIHSSSTACGHAQCGRACRPPCHLLRLRLGNPQERHHTAAYAQRPQDGDGVPPLRPKAPVDRDHGNARLLKSDFRPLPDQDPEATQAMEKLLKRGKAGSPSPSPKGFHCYDCQEGYDMMTRACIIATAIASLAAAFVVFTAAASFAKTGGLAAGGWRLAVATVLTIPAAWLAVQLWKDREELFQSTYQGKSGGRLIKMPDA